jgi:predicted Fe-Mo cluster-binding NifX family protein
MLRKSLKIAVPTDDGIILGKQFKCARAFLVATIQSGQIVCEDLRWNLLSEIMTSDLGFFYNLEDCNTVIVNDIGPGHTEMLKARKITVIRTKESHISMAFSKYLKPILDCRKNIKSF